MKPIAIFRHFFTEGPGYFASFLDEKRIPWQLIRVDEGEKIPTDANQFSGLCFMGGPMSVNDPLSWIEPALQLIRSSVSKDIPVLGHCLGGQLMAKALGGKITRNAVKEIGWHPIQFIESATKDNWLPRIQTAQAFHWHGETFEIPSGAIRIAKSEYCENQMFALGKHLGMQCHIEMTEELVGSWCKSGAQEIEENKGASVQTGNAIQASLENRVSTLNQLGEVIYSQWIKGLST